MIKDDLWPNPLQYFLAADIEVDENGVSRYVGYIPILQRTVGQIFLCIQLQTLVKPLRFKRVFSWMLNLVFQHSVILAKFTYFVVKLDFKC